MSGNVVSQIFSFALHALDEESGIGKHEGDRKTESGFFYSIESAASTWVGEGSEDLRLALSTLLKGWRMLREDINQREIRKDVKQRAESTDSSFESFKDIFSNFS